MSRATSDDQLRFLLSCVKHATNGRVDFVEVAKECGVVSKGAAAKRYERLMKANGISSPSGSALSSAPKTTQSKQKARSSDENPPTAKKQKLERNSTPRTSKRAEDSPRSTTVAIANPRDDACEPTPPKFEALALNDRTRRTLSGPPSMLQLSLPSAMFVPSNSVAQGVPYPARQRSPFVGYPTIADAVGHQLVPDVPFYPPFPPAFREPWTFTGQENANASSGFEMFSHQDYASRQSQGVQPPFLDEAMPMRLPPQPQEVVPIHQPSEHLPEEGDSASKSKGHVVVVE
ncbi:uncharacterized protein Z520_04848 [Fonsecaea multimorphosa CBS 102226]|uniref:Myb-like DNA-binding domain-containing protein n=1 Tax=Fonsecaea multimorphosa CBS 102226 TaxID=1442371 RepID=A0A0D2K0C6_9EURO|nr:uncharacterized protein Z520_04848 [Fonsecaea multimorphosa CBS 102226]KIX99272.1 hypothetical protein Z520_04848 [Fonsecaea multimorphosa CBS 102226]OAL25962.1 hypothetical protein AYO22_04589 [Fonsecaea multimorphosa]